MRSRIPLFFALCLVPALSGADIAALSRLDSVEVFHGQARLTRVFEAEIPAGSHTLIFRGLPGGTDTNSIQLEVEHGQLRLGAVSVDREFTLEDESDRLRELRQQLETLEQQKAERQQERKLAEEYAAHHRDLLAALRDGIRETGEADLYPVAQDGWANAAAAQRDAFAQIRAIDEQIRQLDRSIPEVRRRYQERLEQDRRAATELRVEVESAGGAAAGRLTYVTAGASWSPAYRVEATPAENRLGLNYLASVHQSTGEDWTDVTLRLSTGNPAIGGAPIEPPPVILRRYDPDELRQRGYTEMAAPMMKVAHAQDATRSFEMAAMETLVSTSTTGFEATLPGRVVVPSGKEARLLPVLEESVEAEFWSVTIPLTAERAFLGARFENPFELPLLPGTTQLFVDGRLTGQGSMEETLPGADVEVGLGENQNIEVKRVLVKEEASRSGIISRSHHEERRFRIEVTNRMPVPQRVVIKERLPISRDEDIRVELRAPRGVDVDPETGLFETEVTLEPGASAEVLTHFTVSYPRDWQVSGGY